MDIVNQSISFIREVGNSFSQWAYPAIQLYGYPAMFIVSIIGCATIIFPLPIDLLIFLSGAFLDPIILGIVSGVGCAIGELTGYLCGRAGAYTMDEERLRKYSDAFRKYGFWLIPFAAFTPFPMDVVGIVAGVLKYDLRLFFIGVVAGKVPRCLILAYAGSFSIPFLMRLIGF